jgi:TRAP transporter 4TM/12TM fusion protein
MNLGAGKDPAASAGRSVALAGFLLGTVSGSGVATTVTLGSVAWPVLKRVGFAADTAGAMLAASGIGALISPPTLGAAAFLIAEYLDITYLQVLVMATIPTVLYYTSIVLMIEGEATSRPAGGSAVAAVSSETGRVSSAADRRYLHFLSLGLVAVLMVAGLTPFRAVFWAMVASLVVWVLVSRDMRSPRGLLRGLGQAFVGGGADALPILATTAVAGIIVGVVTLTGLGLKAAGLIVGLAGGSLPSTVLLAAAAVWLLGLAVPVTASYIISAVMVVPALTEVGVAPVAAHMFIFYYAVLSEVSPPTALAPFAAAAITGGRPFRTMMLTWKYALPAFVVPIAFAVHPEGLGLLLQAGWADVAWQSASALAGVAALAGGAGGWRMRGASVGTRAAAVLGGLLLFGPDAAVQATGLAVAAAGFAVASAGNAQPR